MRVLRLAALLLILGTALSISYRVDPEGGPDTLMDEVTAALDAWLELDETLELETDDEATTVFSYGEASLFGPDTVSLTVQRQNPSGVDILLQPSPSGRANALLHETGLVLGLSVSDEGVMNPAIDSEVLELGEIEAAGLRQELDALPEDLNFDGEVNFYDLAELAKSFGQSGFSLRADIDESGVVDEADVERLRAAYTFSEPSATPPEEDDLLTDEPPLEDPLGPSETEEEDPGNAEDTTEEGEAEEGAEGVDDEQNEEQNNEEQQEPTTDPEQQDPPGNTNEADPGEGESNE